MSAGQSGIEDINLDSDAANEPFASNGAPAHINGRWSWLCARCQRADTETLLLSLTVLGVVLGTIIGIATHSADPSPEAIKWVSFPGELLLRMLKCLVVPLLVASLIVGITSLGDISKTGRIGKYTLTYYISTTLIAVTLGLILVVAIHPGHGGKEEEGSESEALNANAADALMDLVRNMFPDNLVQSAFVITQSRPSNMTSTGVELEKFDGMNVLGLITFSIVFAVVLTTMGHEAQPLLSFFESLNIAIMKMVDIVMWYAPLGIMSLIAGKLAEAEEFSQLVQDLGLYVLTVILGLIIHSAIILPLIFYFLTRKNPFKYLSGVSRALLTAFGTSSSSASLPVTFKCLENNNNISPEITGFMLPVGASLNMDGTALYEAVAAVFIAQLNGIDLSFAQLITVSLTSTLASVGAAGIPNAGLFTMVLVLTAVGLPTEDVSFILAVDWLLDRLRTTVNVMGDSYGCGIVQHILERNGDLDKASVAVLGSAPRSSGYGVLEEEAEGDSTA